MLKAQHIQGTAGSLFCTMHLPGGPPPARGWPAVLSVPAFGDEMNKTRATLAQIGARLNRSGIALMIPDLTGTGDSQGEFADATWTQWLQDLTSATVHARTASLDIRGVLAVRTGVLLAMEALHELPLNDLSASVWLQAVDDGDRFLSQLLRIRTMSKAVSEGASESVEMLRERLCRGETINVGGYELPPGIGLPLAERQLATLANVECGALLAVDATRLTARAGERLEMVGKLELDRLGVVGEPYWSAAEIVVNEQVVAAAVDHLVRHMGARAEERVECVR